MDIDKGITTANNTIADNISTLIDLQEKKPSMKTCPNCDFVISKKKMECNKCHHNLANEKSRSALYESVPSKHPEEPPIVKIGEIIGVNPNARETVKEAMIDLSIQAKLGEKRFWVRYGFDGVPYRISNSLRNEIVQCSVCKKLFDTRKDDMRNHFESEHGSLEPSYSKYFGDILLVPGAGHIEKNFLMAIFSLCRPIFMETIAVKLGFRSKKAVEFIINVGDHHLGWQIASIAYEAFAKELIFVYCVESRKLGIEPTPNGLTEWRDKVVNPNYHLIFDITFNLLLGMKCYRSGIRKNNSEFALAGRQKVAPLMYINEHRIYHDLLHNDMRIRVQAPKEIKEYIERNESFSRSGDETRGEGGDYITENENKHLKSHLPPGVPTLQSWRQAARNHQVLTDNRANVYERLRSTDPTLTQSSVFKFEEEVRMLRCMIRKSNWLQYPYERVPLQSLDGKPLHMNLVDFYLTALENYDEYIKDPTTDNLRPVFRTQDDANAFYDINTWRKESIRKASETLISQLQSEEKQDMFKKLLQSTVQAKKERQVAVFIEVRNALRQELSSRVIDELEVEKDE